MLPDEEGAYDPLGFVFQNGIVILDEMDPIPIQDLIAHFAGWKEGHGKNTIILRSMSGAVSALSSSVLIWMIVRSHKGLSTTQHRILLGLSICDLVNSLGFSTFNIMAPSDNKYGVWNAKGNEASCDAQGFLIYLGSIGGLCYNVSLNLYYLAVVKYNKSEDYIRTKVEPFLHGVPIVMALAYSIIGLVGNHLNDADGVGICTWPVHYPPHCYGYDVGEVRDGFDIPCGRGLQGAVTFLIGAMVLMLIPVFIIIASLAVIYRAVKKQESKISTYGVNALNISTNVNDNDTQNDSMWKRIRKRLSQTPLLIRNYSYRRTMSNNNTQSHSRAVMHKAFQYSSAWFLSWGIFNLYLMIPNPPPALLYIASIFLPLQGFYNLCIYMYPKVVYARIPRHGQEKVYLYQAIYIAFWSRGRDPTSTRNRRRNNMNNNNPPRQASNLSSDSTSRRTLNLNRPLRTKTKSDKNEKNSTTNSDDMMKTTELVRIETTLDTRCVEPKEIEEEKCEIQPPSTHHKVSSHLTYAPNNPTDTSYPVSDSDINTDTDHDHSLYNDIDSTKAKDASEVSDDGNEERIGNKDKSNINEDAMSMSSSSECNNAARDID